MRLEESIDSRVEAVVEHIAQFISSIDDMINLCYDDNRVVKLERLRNAMQNELDRLHTVKPAEKEHLAKIFLRRASKRLAAALRTIKYI